MSLKRAREKRDEAKALLADGVNPSMRRRVEKLSHALTFGLIAREWLEPSSKACRTYTCQGAVDIREHAVPRPRHGPYW